MQPAKAKDAPKHVFVGFIHGADMTPLKKPTTKHDPLLKFKSAYDTKLVDFVPGDSSKQFSISANMDPT